MKNFVRLICVAALAFSITACFAGEKEEQAELDELNSQILKPITDHFSESRSFTRLVSLKMMEMQKKRGKIVGRQQNKLRYDEATRIVERELGEKLRYEIDNVDTRCAYSQPGGFARYLSVSWAHEIADCSFYAQLVIATFVFNHMNILVKKERSWLFKEAALIAASPDNGGDHVLVLVEGNSGAMFVVDPWIRRVVKLKGVTKLTEIDTPDLSVLPYYPNPKSLNILFSDHYNGVDYYDEWYVSENTKWVLIRALPMSIEKKLYTYDVSPDDELGPGKYPYSEEEFDKYLDLRMKDKILHMADVYMYLRPNFPGWQAGYKELFGKSSLAKSKDLERKTSV